MFVQNLFQDYYEPTLEDNYRKCMTTVGKQSCLIDAMDDLSSYESMDGYIKKTRLVKPNAPIILVGNKIDLPSTS
jgi:GTPase SAR1 family protein